MEEFKREGTTVYSLHQTGWDKGKPVMTNKFYAQVYPDYANGVTEEDAEKVAMLFKAAPELLEALQECMNELYSIHSQYGDKENARDHSSGLRKAEKAINKALGKEKQK
jgi:hypothetical protein